MLGQFGNDVHQDVGQLDVPVHEPGRMRGVQRGRHLRGERGGLVARQPPTAAPQQPLQVPARYEPRRDVQQPLIVARRVHRDDVRRVHRRARPRLPQEPGPKLLIVGQRRRDDLQRGQPTEHLIARPEDHGHAAGSDLLLDQVACDPAARPQPSEGAVRPPREVARHPVLLRRGCVPGRARRGWPDTAIRECGYLPIPGIHYDQSWRLVANPDEQSRVQVTRSTGSFGAIMTGSSAAFQHRTACSTPGLGARRRPAPFRTPRGHGGPGPRWTPLLTEISRALGLDSTCAANNPWPSACHAPRFRLRRSR